MPVRKYWPLIAALALLLEPLAIGVPLGKRSSLRQIAMVYIPGDPGF